MKKLFGKKVQREMLKRLAYWGLSISSTLVALSACSVVSNAVSEVSHTLKTDVQTAHDENFRLKRVRKSLREGKIEEAEQHRDTLFAEHWKIVANIEIASHKYANDREEAVKMIDEVREEVWELSDPNQRSIALIALVKFELEVEKDVARALGTIRQTEKTIQFIEGDEKISAENRQGRRLYALDRIIEANNHIISRYESIKEQENV